MRRPATIQEPTMMTTLNPAAPVFVPSSKGHKTLAAAAMNLSGDKKIPAPANNAGERCIPAIRPPSARCERRHTLSCTSMENQHCAGRNVRQGACDLQL